MCSTSSSIPYSRTPLRSYSVRCRPVLHVRLHGKRKANGTVANSKAGGAGPDSRHTELARGSFRTRRRRAVCTRLLDCAFVLWLEKKDGLGDHEDHVQMNAVLAS